MCSCINLPIFHQILVLNFPVSEDYRHLQVIRKCFIAIHLNPRHSGKRKKGKTFPRELSRNQSTSVYVAQLTNTFTRAGSVSVLLIMTNDDFTQKAAFSLFSYFVSAVSLNAWFMNNARNPQSYYTHRFYVCCCCCLFVCIHDRYKSF